MGEEQQQPAATGRLILRAPKEGERILEPTRRPDGSLRKPVRIRAGYVPQDEVALYQAKGVIMRKAQPEEPPGYDPEAAMVSKPKTKSAKRNERKKEKKLQAALASSDDKGKQLDLGRSWKLETEEISFTEKPHRLESVDTVTYQISNLAVSSIPEVASPSTDQVEPLKCDDSGPDIDKRIRALKKKIRLVDAQVKGDQQNLNAEQLEKMTKVEGWREELKALEDKKANAVS